MNGTATSRSARGKNHSFSNVVAQNAPQRTGAQGASLLQPTVNVRRIRSSLKRFSTRSRTMKGELPLERQAVQVQINNGDWQAATYQDGQFVDLYGLPLDHRKVTSWRPVGAGANGRASPNRNLGAEQSSSRAH
jgi:hypothetical protein